MEKHCVTIENREMITITDVKGIDTFDEEEVCVQLTEGSLIVRGKRMHIQRLDLEEAVASVSGEIRAVTYSRKNPEKNILKKLRK